MKKKKEHLTLQVILGYASLIMLAIVAVLYVFDLVSKMAGLKDGSDGSRDKVYQITHVLSLLYEGETHTQFFADPDKEFEQFERIMDKVHDRMDSLRLLIDSVNWSRIDTINNLLDKKRENVRLIFETTKEADSVYAKSIAKEKSISREIRREIEIRKTEESSTDTIVSQRERKGFFRRLAEAFVPIKEDTSIHVNATSQIKIDSLAFTYDPNEEIATVLLRLQNEITAERARLTDVLTNRTHALRLNDRVIAGEINRILVAIEEEEDNRLGAEEQAKQEMIRKASKHLALISVIAIIVLLFFLVLTFRDIWRSRYYRRQLEKAKQYAEDLLQSREKLMLTISHDIRAPLSSILGYVDLLKKGNPAGTQREYLDNMQVSGGHILSLVNDLLDFHRLESGKMEMHPAPFLVPPLFREIYTGFKPLADAKGLDFNLHLSPADTEQAYLGDTVRIRQVVGNLLSNAIKFTSEGKVLLDVAVGGGENGTHTLTVSVKDEGAGIAPEEQQKIFGEFTRLSGAEKADGFGLGLSITGKLVSLMDGNISLHSVPGEGSVFTVVLPLPLSDEKVAAEKPERQKEAALLMPAGRKINCLVIDDDNAQIRLTEELLKRSQVNVIALTNPHTAVDLLGKASFDVILTDIQMPGMDGYALLRQIRSSDVAGADTIPVVALSASAEEDRAHYIAAGFSGFLSKPFMANDLVALLNELLAVSLPPVDLSSLAAFAGEDQEALNDILTTFAEETTKSLGLMKEALTAGDHEQTARLAHKLIPLLKMLEAGPVVEQLKSLEKEELTGEAWETTVDQTIERITAIVEQVRFISGRF